MEKNIVFFCPFCEEDHEVDYVEEYSTIKVKGEDVTYKSCFYRCPKHPEEPDGFVNGSMMDENLQRARNAYRMKKGLLTSDEIVAIRKKYKLSQVELSDLLGWGGATVSRYETKQIQDETHNELLRQVRDNPMFVYHCLRRHYAKFTDIRYSEIKSLINDELDNCGYLERELLKSNYVHYSEPSILNGFKALDIDKLVSVINYLAEHIVLHKTKLMKLLWYSDMLNYKKYNHSMTGLVYLHQPYGALPVGPIMDLKEILYEVEYDQQGYEKFRVYPNKDIKMNNLSKEEIAILEEVIDKFSSMKTNEIVEYMHKEKAYLNTRPKEEISYEYASSLNEF